MKVFVTGASGFVGRSVVARLVADGHDVRALLRSGSSHALFKLPRIETVEGDITDPSDLTACAKGCEAAIHTVGILRPQGTNTFEAVHVSGTQHVLDACRSAGIQRLVHISALGVGRGTDTPYLVTKEAGEQRVRTSGLDWTILRPSVIHGPRGAFMIMMARMVARAGPVPLVGRGDQVMQPIWVEDVARLCSEALKREATIGQAYGVAGPEPIALRTFYKVLSRVLLGTGKWCLGVPLCVVRAGAWLAARLFRDPPITPDELRMLLAARPCDIRPMIGAFGFEPAAFEPTVRQYADELKTAAGLA